MTTSINQTTSIDKTSAATGTSVTGQQTATLPDNILLDKWRDSGFFWEGELMPKQLPRLHKLLSQSQPATSIGIRCQLKQQDNTLQLHFSVVGQVELVCQRCLQPLQWDVSDTHVLWLLEHAEQAELLEDDDDFVLLEEVVQGDDLQPKLPLKALIEDEILLDVPISAKHNDCDMAVTQVGEVDIEEKTNPFAALAALKQND